VSLRPEVDTVTLLQLDLVNLAINDVGAGQGVESAVACLRVLSPGQQHWD
jgi:hypothetical protein